MNRRERNAASDGCELLIGASGACDQEDSEVESVVDCACVLHTICDTYLPTKYTVRSLLSDSTTLLTGIHSQIPMPIPIHRPHILHTLVFQQAFAMFVHPYVEGIPSTINQSILQPKINLVSVYVQIASGNQDIGLDL
jgi:hypothetical protein